MKMALFLIMVLYSLGLYALDIKLINNLPKEFSYSLMTVNSTTGGLLERDDSVNLDLPEVGGAISHNGQALFSVFPTIERIRVSSCCGLGSMQQLSINGQMAHCGIIKYDFANSLEIELEPCEV